MGILRVPAFRLAAGIVVSVAFLGLTLARVDLGGVGDALARTEPGWLLLALAVVAVDLWLRAVRWRVLLGAVAAGRAPAFVRVAAYLTVGYLANSILPARLGDVARAYLAGAAFGVPRMATFGTIVIERIADGATMLILAVLSSAIVARVVEVRFLAAYAVSLALAGAVVLAIGAFVLYRTPLGSRRYPRVIGDLARRVTVGATALKSRRGLVLVIVATLAAALTATLLGWAVAQAVGIWLGGPEAVLFASGLALSLAIPAAPASIGTFEFVGVVILSSVGASPERALAAILLMRVVSTVPLSLLGVGATWALHLRATELIDPTAPLVGETIRDAGR